LTSNKSTEYLKYLSLGVEIAAGLAGPILAGIWLDSIWDSSPWMLVIGVICAIGLFTATVLRLAANGGKGENDKP
jgi:ATP synthase protein I